MQLFFYYKMEQVVYNGNNFELRYEDCIYPIRWEDDKYYVHIDIDNDPPRRILFAEDLRDDPLFVFLHMQHKRWIKSDEYKKKIKKIKKKLLNNIKNSRCV